jgi:hypothetical protein
MSQKSVFENFTNKYSLSKTLRFELKPVGKTRENIEKTNPKFIHDQGIEDAYQILKPVFDKLHGNFITKSLENDKAKEMDFSKYLILKKELLGIDKKKADKDFKNKEKEIESEEKKLREFFGDIYKAEGEVFKIEAGLLPNGKSVLKEDGYRVLTEAGILNYIRKNIDTFAVMNLKTRNGEIISKEDLVKALGSPQTKGLFEGFFTYFGGFNQNRENYYTIKEEKATAVASRVVGENLPKFCDNILDFEKRKIEYEKALKFLEDNNIALIDKDQNPLYAITSSIFEITHFNACMSQTGIEAYNKEIGNANFVINLYNQQQIDKSKKLRFFKILYKQIGCGEKGEFIESIKTLEELKERLVEVATKGDIFFHKILKKKDIHNPKSEDGLFEKILNLNDFRGVYWSDKALNTISLKYFGDWMTLKELLYKEKIFKSDKGEIKVPQVIELPDLFSVLDSADSVVAFKEYFKDNDGDKQNIKNELNLSNSQKLLKMIFKDIEMNKNIFENKKNDVLVMTNHKQDENTKVVKDWLDSLLFTNQILKYFKVRENKIKGSPLNAEIYNSLEEILFQDNPTKEYDIIRNYLTQKPTEEINKLKLNFENASLVSGWDLNKEKNNSGVVLKGGDGRKYLVIMKKENTKIFEKTNTNQIFTQDNSGWVKMEYKLVPGASKTLPKVLFSAKWKKHNPTPSNIEKIYKDETFKKGENFVLKDLHALIDFYKEQLKKYPLENDNWNKMYNFNFSRTDLCMGIDGFYGEVDKQGYKIEFVPINKIILDKLVEEGKVYLFEIRNKDNQSGKTGRDNLHTIYWNAVFSGVENKPKLNGEAEIFYRPALKVEGLGKKRDKKDREVIDHKRFAEEKFVFHCPITLNFCIKSSKLNDEINILASENSDDIRFIGIDRGEKHLAYYSVINQKGEIIDQGSFNEINGQNYAAELEKRVGNRDEARKNWKTIGTIKELKDGYISQVVRKIVDLAVQHNAYIVLEKLDKGFKRGRQKIEKQVYQKLELALAKKLNFLVDKKVEIGTVGSVTNALQLTPPVANFQDIEGKSQFGIMLYVRANYTSQTDPVTGWRKSIYLKKGSEGNIKDQIKKLFKDIQFDGKDYYFEYLDQNNKPWRLYSGKNGVDLDRYYRERTHESIEGEMRVQWTPKKQEIKNTLDILFENCDKNRSIFTQIIDEGVELKKIDTNRTAWESLRFMIDVIQQIRNTGTDSKDDDFLLSPVRDRNENYFDSRKDGAMIPNGDANGAYNIARKGLMLFQKENGIKQKPEKPDLFIEDKEWDLWLQNRKN